MSFSLLFPLLLSCVSLAAAPAKPPSSSAKPPFASAKPAPLPSSRCESYVEPKPPSAKFPPRSSKLPYPLVRRYPMKHKPPSMEQIERADALASLVAQPARVEVQRWLAPLAPASAGATAGLESTSYLVKTYISARWGMNADPSALERLREMGRAFGAWNPYRLYKQLHTRAIDSRFFSEMRDMELRLRSPNKAEAEPPRAPGQGLFRFEMKPLQKDQGEPQPMQPFLLILHARIGMLFLYTKQFDRLLLDFLARATQPDLAVEPEIKQPPRFPLLPSSSHSRRVASWLQSRLPRTARLLDTYVHIRNVLEPTSEGRYKFDAQLSWNLDSIAKDYWQWVDDIRKDKTRIFLQTELLDDNYRRWFQWTYSSRKQLHRFEALVSKDGFHLCDSSWKPVLSTSAWRPTENLTSQGFARTQFFYSSSSIQVAVSDILFSWKVRPTKKGASMHIEFARVPQIRLEGGEFLRALARIVIPGGVEALLQRFLKTLVVGEGGRGLRWTWEIVEDTTHSDLTFRLVIPVIPDKILTSLLRLAPRSFRGGATQARRPSAVRQTASQMRRSLVGGQRSLWHRLFLNFFYDLYDSFRHTK